MCTRGRRTATYLPGSIGLPAAPLLSAHLHDGQESVQESQELPGRHQGQTDGGSGPEHELAALDELGGLI